MNRTTCRACGSTNKELVLDLGSTPLADAFPKTIDEQEKLYPLSVSVCTDCWLMQLDQDIPDEELFSSDYGFFTGASPSAVKYFEEYADDVKRRYPEQSKGFVVEIASNDGTLLKHFKEHSRRLWGIDPAEPAAEEAMDNNFIPTLVENFTDHLANKFQAEYERADLIMANNVLAHVIDPLDFLKGIKTLLAPDGVAIIEFQYAVDLLFRNQFDHFYHEHRSFFSIISLEYLLGKCGLKVQNIQHTPAQGGSLRVHLKHGAVHLPPFADWWGSEKVLEIDNLMTYATFHYRVEYIADELERQLRDLKAQGKRIYGYGASAKSTTLLNFCGIGPDLLDCVVDTTPHKLGRFTPGTKIPIVGPGERPDCDCYLVLVWNYLPGIIRREQEYMNKGGKFLVPVPAPTLI
jgi:SAM-dependent methyltransferase